MADADSLIEGKGTVKKNIHWFIGGLVAIVIVVAIFAQDATSRKNKAQKAKEPVTMEQPVVNSSAIKSVLESQKETKIPDATLLANEKPGVPAIAVEGVGANAKQTEVISAKEAQAVEDAKRDAQLNGSSILAINTEASGLEKLSGINRQPIDVTRPLNVNQEDLRKAMIEPATTNPDPQQTPDLTKKTTAIKEDPINSPYTIFEGAVIPAVLMTQISSQLPGQVTGVVSQDVYDGVTGRYLVIPKGALLYGSYNSSVVQGQDRLMVAFTRLILPNGRSVSLLGMPSADKTGQQGLEGDVNNHYLQRYGVTFMTALLGTYADKQKSGNTTVINTGSAGSSSGVSTAAGTILVDAARAEQQRTSQIKSTITIKQGEKFNINVNRDIAIDPYK